MAIIRDESFKRAGAVPFSWEIRPGIPKTHPPQPDNLNPPTKLSPLRLKPLSPQPLHPPPPRLQPPSSSFISTRRPLSPLAPPSFSTPSPSSKLKPPPASAFYSASPRTPSFRSSPRAFSQRWRPTRVRPGSDSVEGTGCFPTPMFRLRKSKSSGWKKTAPRLEPDYGSDMTLSPWSVSSRRSISPMWDSPKSSFSSSRFSPRFAGEAEWVGIGLF